jgi:DNA-binding CsgD family transcriptional regulator/tetratricopeptide (TPR) repeat protein
MPRFPARSPFVGREAELQRLRAAFDDAQAGAGLLVLVVGEPGIGKTALTHQLAVAVGEAGGQVLTGRSYGAGSPALPYLPFIEILRTAVLARTPEQLQQELGDDAAEIARLVPELRQRLSLPSEPETARDPEEARYRLLRAVAGFLCTVAASQPLVLVLEDLHDGDRGTLDLLLFLARRLSDSRLLVVGTYRDVEVDRAHPLSGALAELPRVTAVERLHLRGLPPVDVQHLAEAIAGIPLPAGLAAAVAQQTEGNPLFVQEVSRYLVEEGLLRGDDGARPRGGAGTVVLGIPEGLRDVIGKRLSRLSADCNRLLAVAAVIGREFDLDTLRAVAGMDEGMVDGALAEATRAAVLEEELQPGAVRYRFAHAFFRQTLYEELSAPRRLRLHQQIARDLEQRYHVRLSEHAAELAEHFAQSTDPTDLAKAVRYGELAAERAAAVYAYGEAARLLEQALQVQEVLDPNDSVKRSRLLLALGEALLPTGDHKRVADEIAPAAYVLAEGVGDAASAAHACRLAIVGLLRAAGVHPLRTPAMSEWSARADAVAQPRTLERVYADLVFFVVNLGQPGFGDRLGRALKAVRLARRLDDPRALPALQFMAFPTLAPPPFWPQWVELAREMAGWAQGRSGAPDLALLLYYCGMTLLCAGEREEAEALWRQVTAPPSPGHGEDVVRRLLTPMIEMWTQMLDGQIIEGLATAERVAAMVVEIGPNPLGYVRGNPYPPRVWALWMLGRPEEALAVVVEAQSGGIGLDLTMTECLAMVGRHDEAAAKFSQLLTKLGLAHDETEPPWPVLVSPLRSAIRQGDRQTAALLAKRLAGPLATAFDLYIPMAVARLLGDVAAMHGDRAGAREYYEQALAVESKVRSRPGIALTRLAQAELLLDGPPLAGAPSPAPFPARTGPAAPNPGSGGDERAEALAHLEFVIPEFEAMHMQPALERAMRLREQAGGPPNAAETANGAAAANGLTAREREVLGLLATGKTNQEIADALVLSLRTVERHTVNIYAKIGARGRAEAVGYALRHDLGPADR